MVARRRCRGGFCERGDKLFLTFVVIKSICCNFEGLNKKTTMRVLTNRDIAMLEEQGCSAEDWSEVIVDDDFDTSRVRNVDFHGHVEIGSLVGSVSMDNGFVRRCGIRNAVLNNVIIGDGCLVENVGGYISNYEIGDGCLICNVGVIAVQGETNFGNGNLVAVLNEGGDGNVVVYDGLTAQLAWLMLRNKNVRDMAMREAADRNPSVRGTIGDRSRIVGVEEIVNSVIGRACEVQGASRLSNTTILSTDDAPTYIGTDAILDSSVVACGAAVTDGAKVSNSFIGESVHVGKGFSSESSLFFANSHMENGEACATLCGPFSASHHKSTLLIGGMFSFYNAGSATNQSNHAYKMGPIHWGTLERGSKTASGCHILWPAHIGAFSMAMGKITTHPKVDKLPFSYVIASEEGTWLVPAVNLRTVGTWRDVGKWPKRDHRPVTARRDIIDHAFPNPYIIQSVVEGRQTLKKIAEEQGENAEVYTYGNCMIKREALVRGQAIYDKAIRLFIHAVLQKKGGTLDCSEPVADGEWLDMCGMLTPKGEIDRLESDIATGAIGTTDEIVAILKLIQRDYNRNEQAYAISLMQSEADSMFVDEHYWRREGEEAHSWWLSMVRNDAEKEYELGDVDEEQLRNFLNGI